MASFLSSCGRMSSHFENIRLKFPTHVVLLWFLTPYGQNMKILKMYFHDVITNELYI